MSPSGPATRPSGASNGPFVSRALARSGLINRTVTSPQQAVGGSCDPSRPVTTLVLLLRSSGSGCGHAATRGVVHAGGCAGRASVRRGGRRTRAPSSRRLRTPAVGAAAPARSCRVARPGGAPSPAPGLRLSPAVPAVACRPSRVHGGPHPSGAMTSIPPVPPPRCSQNAPSGVPRTKSALPNEGASSPPLISERCKILRLSLRNPLQNKPGMAGDSESAA